LSLWLAGIGVARGIGIGRAQRLHIGDLEVPERALEAAEIDAEIKRFRSAQASAREQLRTVRDHLPQGVPAEIAAFLDSHLLMIDDRALTDAVVALIHERQINAEAALRRQRDLLADAFEQMDDPYLRARRDDVQQVANRVLRALLGGERALPVGTDDGPRPVMVADDLAPADVVLLAQQGVAGFVAEYGGPLSHTAILARSLGIPTVVGVHGARRLLREGETLVVDGERGHVLADPDPRALDFFHRQQEEQAARRAALASLRDRPAICRDGHPVELLANIELPEDAATAAALGAQGVGLYRTEFLFMNRAAPPDEDEQYEAYARVVASVRGPITIRTFDLGADKQVDGRSPGTLPNNPALGLRAIRLCLKDTALFRTQVRALLRASAHGRMQIMLPMISGVSEFRQAQRLIAGARDELRREGRAMAEHVPLGAMIEVPSAALSAHWLARHAEFFSIGTNDLIQYTLAIDRVDDEVNYLYDPLNPGVLRLIRMTIDAGRDAGIPVAMCGEMAGEPRYTRLLLGLGLRSFSMHPATLLEVKRNIIEAETDRLGREVDAALAALDVSETQERLLRLV
jgi:phosphoenolpyruvate--protein phosphotransferase (EC 2.7.3.9)